MPSVVKKTNVAQKQQLSFFDTGEK
jgi:hypothetical protein